jgi:hypothetical protein
LPWVKPGNDELWLGQPEWKRSRAVNA